mmetsp:Transcript_10310/g.25575  ORF Transcript_10310/g.25575 Transcript_10310/m.25575 type:complete len:202 (-) Transcript_10310:1681-2286(-)
MRLCRSFARLHRHTRRRARARRRRRRRRSGRRAQARRAARGACVARALPRGLFHGGLHGRHTGGRAPVAPRRRRRVGAHPPRVGGGADHARAVGGRAAAGGCVPRRDRERQVRRGRRRRLGVRARQVRGRLRRVARRVRAGGRQGGIPQLGGDDAAADAAPPLRHGVGALGVLPLLVVRRRGEPCARRRHVWRGQPRRLQR